MVRITKVYTKTGDQGTTQTADGTRMSKTSCQIEAIGCLDELNASIGFAKVMIKHHSIFNELFCKLWRVQNELFDLGAELSCSEAKRDNTPCIQREDVTRLENEIDTMNAELPVLNSFVIPGNEEMCARLHLARTICRRTERAMVALNNTQAVSEIAIAYLNRLSDWLFVVSRYITFQLEAVEAIWEPGKRNFIVRDALSEIED